MTRKHSLSIVLCTLGLLAIALVVASAIADAPKEVKSNDAKPAAAGAQPEMKLPPGWTESDMQACMLAGTPGKMHEQLAKGVGTWQGKSTMWMFPGSDPVKSDCTSTITSMMDGRYLKSEMAGEMPGMGPYSGFGLIGFDNVTKKFVSTWIDNHSTGLMTGTGALSPDGKTLTWNYNYTCPVTNKPAVMREIETVTGPDTKTLEIFSTEPKSGKEFQMMRIEFTKK
jgi:hypothetical protein